MELRVGKCPCPAYAKGLPCLIPSPTAVSLFQWSVPFLPEPLLGLALGISDFHESRPFLPTCLPLFS